MRTQINQSLRIHFAVSAAGVPVPGLVAGDFTAVLVDPDDSASSVLVVAESLPGLYYVDVPAAFWATNGLGAYVLRVVVAAPALVIEQQVEVYDEASVQVSLTWDSSANQLRVNTWLQRAATQELVGLQNATVRLFDRTGVALVVLQTTVAPDAQGVFGFNFAAPTFLVGETETYLVATIDQLDPAATPVRSYRGVVGCTFSRTS